MQDSWKPSKLDPGFAAAYSTPMSFRTCTIKSDPGTVHGANGSGWSCIPCISCDLFCSRRRSAGSLPSSAWSSLSRSLSFRDRKPRHHRRGARRRPYGCSF